MNAFFDELLFSHPVPLPKTPLASRSTDCAAAGAGGASLTKQGARKHDVAYVYTIVARTYVDTIVAPAIYYWKETIEGKKGAQLSRMKAVRIFNPLHVLAHKTCSGLTTCSPSRVATAATAASVSSATRATPATPASLKEMEKAVVVAGGRSKGGKAQLRAVLTSAMQGDDACLVGVRAWCLMPGSGALLRYGRWTYRDGGSGEIDLLERLQRAWIIADTGGVD